MPHTGSVEGEPAGAGACRGGGGPGWLIRCLGARRAAGGEAASPWLVMLLVSTGARSRRWPEGGEEGDEIDDLLDRHHIVVGRHFGRAIGGCIPLPAFDDRVRVD